MLLIDYSGVAVSAIMATLYKEIQQPPENLLDLVRHVVLNNLRSVVQKGKGESVVVACDSKDYWRRDVFPQYKGSRSSNRTKSPIDWKVVYGCLDQIKQDIRDHFPYKVIEVPRAEADDVIAVLAVHAAKNTTQQGLFERAESAIIVSGDNDFEQLLIHEHIKLWNPRTKQWVKKSPDTIREELALKILKGETSDGIMNVLSEDDCLVDPDKRQTTLRKKQIDLLLENVPPELMTKYNRNKTMIDFSMIPEGIQNQIIQSYEHYEGKGSKSKVFHYLTQHKCIQLLDNISDF